MYRVTPEYKEAMREQVRQVPVNATVYFGLFDETAAPDASFTWAEEAEYSQPINLNSEEIIETSYATFEPDLLRLDGVQSLIPSTGNYLRQGYISKAVSGADGWFEAPPFIDVHFSKEHSIVGLTFAFDPAVDLPTQMTVSSYLGDAEITRETVTNIDEYEYRGEFLLDGIDRILIEFERMQWEGLRARVNTIAFGIGYKYSDGLLKSITEKHSGSPLSLSLPTSSFVFSLYNTNDRFSLESDTALQRFLEEGQIGLVEYNIGEQYIPGGRWRLSDWSVEGVEAQFTMKDELAILNESVFEKSVYDGTERTLHDLALAVLADAKVSDYYLDPYLKKYSSSSPLPIGTHAASLQLIANAGGCQLSVNRDGQISLFKIRNVDLETAYSSETAQLPYSSVETVRGTDNAIYATFEPMFLRADGEQILVPSSADYVNAGWGASDVSADSGTYSGNAVVLSFDDPTNLFQVIVDWGSDTPPAEAVISCRVDGNWTNETEVYPRARQDSYSVSFYHCDAVKIQHSEPSVPGQRPRILYASTSVISDFILNKEQIFEGYKSAMEPKLRNVIAEYLTYSTETETTQIASGNLETNSGTVSLKHNLCVNPTVVVYETGGDQQIEASDVTVIAEHYAYISYISITSPTTKQVRVQINGQKVTTSSSNVISAASTAGEDMTISNPLFTTKELAQEVADWVRTYYTHRVTFEDSVRGFPEIDLFDAIYLDNMEAAMITGSELTYNGAFNQKLTMRKGVV